jgi:hypothetical protein
MDQPGPIRKWIIVKICMKKASGPLHLSDNSVNEY